MEMKLVTKLTDERILASLRSLLILGDKGSAAAGGIDLYFEEMKNQCFVLAMEGDTLAGFMSFKIDHRGAHIPEGKNLYASTSVVHPDFRGQGLMTAFYREMLASFPDRPIYTRTWHENFGHLKVLERLGFHLTELLPNDRGEGIHTVYYCHKP